MSSGYTTNSSSMSSDEEGTELEDTNPFLDTSILEPQVTMMTSLVLDAPHPDYISIVTEDNRVNKEPKSFLEGELEIDWQGIPWNKSALTRESFRKLRRQEYQQIAFDGNKSTGKTTNNNSKSDDNVTFFKYQQFDPHILVDINHPQVRHQTLISGPHISRDMGILHLRGPNRIKHVAPMSSSSSSSSTLYNDATQCLVHFRQNDDFGVIVGIDYQEDWDLLAIAGSTGQICLRRTILPGSNGSEYRMMHLTTDLITQVSYWGNCTIVAASNNGLQILDLERQKLTWNLNSHSPVNAAAVTCEKNTLVIAQDDPKLQFYDLRENRSSSIIELIGHTEANLDVTYISNLIYSGGLDRRLLAHDLRYPTQPAYEVMAKLSYIHTIKQCAPGLIAVAEVDDYVTIYESNRPLNRSQCIDLFGQITGLASIYDPLTGTYNLHVGINNSDYAGLLTLQRRVIGCSWL